MRLTHLQRTPTSYVLRHSKSFRILTLVLCGVLVSFATVPATILIITVGVKLGDLFPIIMAVILSWIISIYLYCLTFGYRIVVDETGVHRYSFNRLKHSLPWRYVRSCGIRVIRVPGRYVPTDRLAFYACVQKNPSDFKERIFMKLNDTDEQALRESGLLSFCHAQMAEADNK